MNLFSKAVSTVLLVAGLGAGQTAPANTPSAAPRAGASSVDGAAKASDAKGMPASAAGESAPYVLGPNDVVQVGVWRDQNLSNAYPIGPDGRLSIPLIGEIDAVGLTVSGLQDKITEKLKGFINDPIVNVQLLRNNSKTYTVVGGVAKGGTFPLLRPTTVLDALASCDGFKEFSNRKKIVLMRGSQKYPFNYNDVVKGKHLEQNILVQNGDTIVVPED